MAGRFVLQELASGMSRSTGRLGSASSGATSPAITRASAGGGIGTLSNLFHGAAVRPGMVVPSNCEILSGSQDGIRTLSNVFHGAAIHPGTALLSSTRGLHGPAARCTGRSRNGMPSSITNHKDLLHEQNMKIIKLQNEFVITKAEMEVLRAEIKTEVTKGQATVLKYCIIILGAGLVGPLLAEWVAS